MVLTEELVALAFFDKSVSFDTKRNMVNSLKKAQIKEQPKCVRIDCSEIGQKELNDFVSKNTAQFFEKLKLSSQFLSIDPTLWAEQDDY